ncbi:integrase [Arenimonas soli]|uniref:Integrase n=1 Tax=Arenimonas soli TaxID=2269504 RepID=A0ABQ1HB68_9GAMM|nr:integrase family protein [Arenimonas soli]GGA69046.1 integrase [Arenimonas soli]
MVKSVPFTEARVRTLRAAAKPGERVEFQDAELKALRLRVSATSASWYLFKRIPGGPMRRLLLGSADDLSVEKARKEAIKAIAKLIDGRDPSAEKRARKAAAKRESLTLAQGLAIYLENRDSLRPATRTTYERDIRTTFGDYLDRPLADLTPERVRERHRLRMTTGARASARVAHARDRKRITASPSRADGAVRALRAVMNYLRAERDMDLPDVARKITADKSWGNVARRKRALLGKPLTEFVVALEATPDDLPPDLSGTQRDLVKLILATGLRISAAAGLRWGEVDLDAAILTVPAARMKGKRDHSLPLGPGMMAMLHQRRADPRGADSEFVFPGAMPDIPLGRLSARFVARLKDSAGKPFVWSPHDLRRTVLTMLEAMDVSAYALKRIAAHSERGDVTAGYLADDVERLRGPMERLERAVFGGAGGVVQFRASRA